MSKNNDKVIVTVNGKDVDITNKRLAMYNAAESFARENFKDIGYDQYMEHINEQLENIYSGDGTDLHTRTPIINPINQFFGNTYRKYADKHIYEMLNSFSNGSNENNSDQSSASSDGSGVKPESTVKSSYSKKQYKTLFNAISESVFGGNKDDARKMWGTYKTYNERIEHLRKALDSMAKDRGDIVDLSGFSKDLLENIAAKYGSVSSFIEYLGEDESVLDGNEDMLRSETTRGIYDNSFNELAAPGYELINEYGDYFNDFFVLRHKDTGDTAIVSKERDPNTGYYKEISGLNYANGDIILYDKNHVLYKDDNGRYNIELFDPDDLFARTDRQRKLDSEDVSKYVRKLLSDINGEYYKYEYFTKDENGNVLSNFGDPLFSGFILGDNQTSEVYGDLQPLFEQGKNYIDLNKSFKIDDGKYVIGLYPEDDPYRYRGDSALFSGFVYDENNKTYSNAILSVENGKLKVVYLDESGIPTDSEEYKRRSADDTNYKDVSYLIRDNSILQNYLESIPLLIPELNSPQSGLEGHLLDDNYSGRESKLYLPFKRAFYDFSESGIESLKTIDAKKVLNAVYWYEKRNPGKSLEAIAKLLNKIKPEWRKTSTGVLLGRDFNIEDAKLVIQNSIGQLSKQQVELQKNGGVIMALNGMKFLKLQGKMGDPLKQENGQRWTPEDGQGYIGGYGVPGQDNSLDQEDYLNMGAGALDLISMTGGLVGGVSGLAAAAIDVYNIFSNNEGMSNSDKWKNAGMSVAFGLMSFIPGAGALKYAKYAKNVGKLGDIGSKVLKLYKSTGKSGKLFEKIDEGSKIIKEASEKLVEELSGEVGEEAAKKIAKGFKEGLEVANGTRKKTKRFGMFESIVEKPKKALKWTLDKGANTAMYMMPFIGSEQAIAAGIDMYNDIKDGNGVSVLSLRLASTGIASAFMGTRGLKKYLGAKSVTKDLKVLDNNSAGSVINLNAKITGKKVRSKKKILDEITDSNGKKMFVDGKLNGVKASSDMTPEEAFIERKDEIKSILNEKRNQEGISEELKKKIDKQIEALESIELKSPSEYLEAIKKSGSYSVDPPLVLRDYKDLYENVGIGRYERDAIDYINSNFSTSDKSYIGRLSLLNKGSLEPGGYRRYKNNEYQYDPNLNLKLRKGVLYKLGGLIRKHSGGNVILNNSEVLSEYSRDTYNQLLMLHILSQIDQSEDKDSYVSMVNGMTDEYIELYNNNGRSWDGISNENVKSYQERYKSNGFELNLGHFFKTSNGQDATSVDNNSSSDGRFGNKTKERVPVYLNESERTSFEAKLSKRGYKLLVVLGGISENGRLQYHIVPITNNTEDTPIDLQIDDTVKKKGVSVAPIHFGLQLARNRDYNNKALGIYNQMQSAYDVPYDGVKWKIVGDEPTKHFYKQLGRELIDAAKNLQTSDIDKYMLNMLEAHRHANLLEEKGYLYDKQALDSSTNYALDYEDKIRKGRIDTENENNARRVSALNHRLNNLLSKLASDYDAEEKTIENILNDSARIKYKDIEKNNAEKQLEASNYRQQALQNIYDEYEKAVNEIQNQYNEYISNYEDSHSPVEVLAEKAKGKSAINPATGNTFEKDEQIATEKANKKYQLALQEIELKYQKMLFDGNLQYVSAFYVLPYKKGGKLSFNEQRELVKLKESFKTLREHSKNLAKKAERDDRRLSMILKGLQENNMLFLKTMLK